MWPGASPRALRHKFKLSLAADAGCAPTLWAAGSGAAPCWLPRSPPVLAPIRMRWTSAEGAGLGTPGEARAAPHPAAPPPEEPPPPKPVSSMLPAARTAQFCCRQSVRCAREASGLTCRSCQAAQGAQAGAKRHRCRATMIGRQKLHLPNFAGARSHDLTAAHSVAWQQGRPKCFAEAAARGATEQVRGGEAPPMEPPPKLKPPPALKALLPRLPAAPGWAGASAGMLRGCRGEPTGGCPVRLCRTWLRGWLPGELSALLLLISRSRASTCRQFDSL